MNKKTFWRRTLSVGIAALLSASAMAGEKLVVANWNDYIEPGLLEKFEAETGIEIDYQIYETDSLAVKWLYSDTPPDVLIIDLFGLPSYIKDGVIAQYDASAIIGYDDVTSMVNNRLQVADPKRNYIVPYFWGRIGLLANTQKVEAALGEPIGKSWDLFFNQEKLRKLSTCGVSVLERPTDMYSLWMNFKGYRPEQPTKSKLSRYVDMLDETSSMVKASNTDYLDELPSGALCMAMAWEGDARVMLAEHKGFDFVLPSEGTTLFIDGMVTPAKSRNQLAAIKFINFMSRPDNAKANAEYMQYNSPFKTVIQQFIAENPDNAMWQSLRSSTEGRAFGVHLTDPKLLSFIDESWTDSKIAK